MPCTVGRCTALATIDGGTENVCVIKLPTDNPCTQASDCQSNECVNRFCAPGSDRESGAACVADEECRFKSCIDGHCRGNATLCGEPGLHRRHLLQDWRPGQYLLDRV